MMVAKLFFLFYLSYPSLSLAWCSGSIGRRSASFSKAQLSKSYLTGRAALLLHNTDNTTKTLESDEPGREHNITKKRNRRLTTNGRLNGLLLAPIRLHLVALTLLAVCVGIVHLHPVAHALESLIYVVDLTKNRTLFPAVNFQPLSMLNWVIHITLFSFSIEFAYSFYLLNKIHPNKTAKKKYARFCTVFSVAILQATFGIISHSQIAYNAKLSWGFLSWDRMLIMNNIFSTGLTVTFGSWILIPSFWAMVQSYIGFHNWTGRILATFTLIIYFGPEIPKTFSCVFLLVPLLGFINPYIKGTDLNHLFDALALNTIFGLTHFAIRGKVFDITNKKVI